MSAELLQCPHCEAIFRIPAGTERIGHVRCGNCAGIFLGDEHGARSMAQPGDEPPRADDLPATEPTALMRPDIDAEIVATPEPTDPPNQATTGEWEPTLDLSDEAADLFIDNHFGSPQDSVDAVVEEFPEAEDGELPGLEETIVMRAPVLPPDVAHTTSGVDTPEHEAAAPDTNETEPDDPQEIAADSLFDDDLLADVLADLPDAEATLTLTDPLLDQAEDSIESIDLSALGGEPTDVPEPPQRDAPDTEETALETAAPEPQTVDTAMPDDAVTEELDAAPFDLPPDTEEPPGSEATVQLSAQEMATIRAETHEQHAEPPHESDSSGQESLEPALDPAATVTADPQADTEAEPEATDAIGPAGPTTAAQDTLPPVSPGIGALLGWSVCTLALLTLLAGQALYAYRGTLQDDPAYRPYLETLCGLLGCELPPLRDLANIAIFGRHVETHPTREGSLLVNASIVNHAPFAQPYPQVLLRFSDAHGAPYAERVFAPQEYLRGPLADPDRFVSEVPVKLSLELIDPGPGAVRYDFKFL